MPTHDWTRVQAGTFHDFHQTWIVEIKRALDAGRLPAGYYAMAEQIVGGWGPDVLALEGPANDDADRAAQAEPSTGQSPGQSAVAIAERPRRVAVHAKAEVDLYARKASAVTIRHSSNHRVVAIIEIVSPGNKNTGHAFAKLIEKAIEVLDAGVHLLVIDLLPPGTFDPSGIHAAIWRKYAGESFAPPAEKPLTLARYIGGDAFEAYVEPTAVGSSLVDMPLFLDPDSYVPTPRELTYQSAFEAVPAVRRKTLEEVRTT
jgi:hypothetical protein